MEIINLLIGIAKFFVGPPWTWKKGFLRLFITTIIILSYVLYLIFQKDKYIHDLSQIIVERSSEIESLKVEVAKRDNKFKILGVDVETNSITSLRTIDEFIRDWDISDFYLMDNDTICPKDKGKNKYQRIFYKYDTPLTASNFNLKFRMVDQDNRVTDYAQRVVMGLELNKMVFSEYDVPTRNSPVINFRIASESGGLVSGGEGKSINSLIKDRSTINLKFQTKLKHGQEITQILELDYISMIDAYGSDNKSVSYDTKVNDSRPETARARLFIGSYMGGCIKIIDWYAS